MKQEEREERRDIESKKVITRQRDKREGRRGVKNRT